MQTTNEILKKIKYSRLKPEEQFLTDIFTELEEFIDSNRYVNMIFYKKDKKVLFSFNPKSGSLCCNNDEVWDVLSKKYKLDYYQIKPIVAKFAEDYLNIEVSINPNIKMKNVYIQMKFFEFDDNERIPEANKYLDKMISKVDTYISDKFDSSLFFKNGRFMIYCYNFIDNTFWYSYNFIFSKLFFKFRLEENEIEEIINSKMKLIYDFDIKEQDKFINTPVNSKDIYLFNPKYFNDVIYEDYVIY